MSQTPEQLQGSAERGVEVARQAGERLEQLENQNAERGVENNPEKTVEKARAEVETAIGVESGGAERKSGGEPTTPTRRGRISKAEQKHEFKQRMTSVRSHMSAPSRSFSKVIHNPAVEKTSEVVGSTVARPNAILAGSVAAFILTTALYLVAKNVGYSLSGFETIGAFILGWIIGITFDYFRIMFTGRPS